jgi:hypothetical protein
MACSGVEDSLMSAFSLNTIEVASPCPADWNEMHGDDRMRFCGLCNLHVYNLSGMTRAEAKELVLRTSGKTRVCVRFMRRVDGTVLTQDCPVGLERFRRRVIRCVGGVVGFLVSVVFVLPAMIGSSRGSAPLRQVPGFKQLFDLHDPKGAHVMMGAMPLPPGFRSPAGQTPAGYGDEDE